MLSVTRDALILESLVSTKLEPLRLVEGVIGITLSAQKLQASTAHTPDLFSATAAANLPLPRLLERLQNKLGTNICNLGRPGGHRKWVVGQHAIRRCAARLLCSATAQRHAYLDLPAAPEQQSCGDGYLVLAWVFLAPKIPASAPTFSARLTSVER